MSVSIATKGIINAAGPGFGGGGVIYRDKPITRTDIVNYLKKVGVSAKLALTMEDDSILDLLQSSKVKTRFIETVEFDQTINVNIIAESKDFVVKVEPIKSKKIIEEQKTKTAVPGQTINNMEDENVKDRD